MVEEPAGHITQSWCETRRAYYQPWCQRCHTMVKPIESSRNSSSHAISAIRNVPHLIFRLPLPLIQWDEPNLVFPGLLLIDQSGDFHIILNSPNGNGQSRNTTDFSSGTSMEQFATSENLVFIWVIYSTLKIIFRKMSLEVLRFSARFPQGILFGKATKVMDNVFPVETARKAAKPLLWKRAFTQFYLSQSQQNICVWSLFALYASVSPIHGVTVPNAA
jgi:hypothetical protein